MGFFYVKFDFSSVGNLFKLLGRGCFLFCFVLKCGAGVLHLGIEAFSGTHALWAAEEENLSGRTSFSESGRVQRRGAPVSRGGPQRRLPTGARHTRAPEQGTLPSCKCS